MARTLTRDPDRGVIAGVAAGLGGYFDVDIVLVRILFIFLAVFGGAGIILYPICWFLMPRPDRRPVISGGGIDNFAEEVREAGAKVANGVRRAAPATGRGRQLAGLVLIVIGLLFLVEEFWPVPWMRLRVLWPLLVIALGLVILLPRTASAPGDGKEKHVG